MDVFVLWVVELPTEGGGADVAACLPGDGSHASRRAAAERAASRV